MKMKNEEAFLNIIFFLNDTKKIIDFVFKDVFDQFSTGIGLPPKTKAVSGRLIVLEIQEHEHKNTKLNEDI